MVLWSFSKPVSDITYLKTLLKVRGIIIPVEYFPENVRARAKTLGRLQSALTESMFTVNLHRHIVRRYSKIYNGGPSDYAMLGDGWENILIHEEPTPIANSIQDVPTDAYAGTW